MTRKSVISVVTIKIIELDVCTASSEPKAVQHYGQFYVMPRTKGRAGVAFRLLPSARERMLFVLIATAHSHSRSLQKRVPRCARQRV